MSLYKLGEEVIIAISKRRTTVTEVFQHNGVDKYTLAGMGSNTYSEIDLLPADDIEVVAAAVPVVSEAKHKGSLPGKYRLEVDTRTGVHDVECGDIIDALDLNHNLGELFKVLWSVDDGPGDIANLNKALWLIQREQLRRKHISQANFWRQYE